MPLEQQPIRNVPAILYSRQEIRLDVACGEYTLSCGLGSISPELFAQRTWCDETEWSTGAERLGSVKDLGTITVVLPLSNEPARVAHFGLTDLHTEAQLFLSEV